MQQRAFRATVMLLAPALLAGCATTTLVDTTSGATVRSALESKNRVSLATDDGLLYELQVVEVSDIAITGVDTDGVLVVLPFAEISSLHAYEARPLRTAAAVTGVLAMTATAAKYPVIALAGVLIGWE